LALCSLREIHDGGILYLCNFKELQFTLSYLALSHLARDLFALVGRNGSTRVLQLFFGWEKIRNQFVSQKSRISLDLPRQDEYDHKRIPSECNPCSFAAGSSNAVIGWENSLFLLSEGISHP
jgi:hypothetical protein